MIKKLTVAEKAVVARKEGITADGGRGMQTAGEFVAGGAREFQPTERLANSKSQLAEWKVLDARVGSVFEP